MTESKLNYSTIRNVIRSTPYQQPLHRSSVNTEITDLRSQVTKIYQMLNLPIHPDNGWTELDGIEGLDAQQVSAPPHDTVEVANETHKDNQHHRKEHTFTATFEIPDSDSITSTAAPDSQSTTSVSVEKSSRVTTSIHTRRSAGESTPLIKHTWSR